MVMGLAVGLGRTLPPTPKLWGLVPGQGQMEEVKLKAFFPGGPVFRHLGLLFQEPGGTPKAGGRAAGSCGDPGKQPFLPVSPPGNK